MHNAGRLLSSQRVRLPIVAVLVAGCAEGRASERLTVTVSVVPQAWVVRQIGGDDVAVLTMVQPGADPHTYQPTDAQVSAVMRGRVYFRIGVPFERGPWFQAIQRSATLSVVDMRRGIELREMAGARDLQGHSHHASSFRDPHIWLSPRLLKVQAKTVTDALVELDPPRSTRYLQRLSKLLRRLDEVDTAIRSRLEPYKGRAFFVLHPAWGYFADAYDLRQFAIEREGKSPTDAELTELQRSARREGIKVVFVQSQVTGRAARAVATAIGARLERLDPLAADVDANLLRLADAIAESFE